MSITWLATSPLCTKLASRAKANPLPNCIQNKVQKNIIHIFHKLIRMFCIFLLVLISYLKQILSRDRWIVCISFGYATCTVFFDTHATIWMAYKLRMCVTVHVLYLSHVLLLLLAMMIYTIMIHVRMCVCMCVCMHACMVVGIHVLMHIYIYIYIYIYITLQTYMTKSWRISSHPRNSGSFWHLLQKDCGKATRK